MADRLHSAGTDKLGAGYRFSRSFGADAVAIDLASERVGGVTSTLTVQRSEPNFFLGLRRGISRRCPACGEGKLFCGYLAVIPVCSVCGNDNEQYPSDDFAPYVTIFLVLHIMVPMLFAADRAWDLALGVEMTLAIPIFAIATLTLLPFAKGGVIGFAWSRGVVRNPATFSVNNNDAR